MCWRIFLIKSLNIIAIHIKINMKKLEDYTILPLLPNQPVADPQVSPGGDKVLFTRSKINFDKNRYESNIWQLSLDGGEPYQFTSGIGRDSNPRWSPDGRHVLFLSDRAFSDKEDGAKGKTQLWVMPSSGGEARRLTDVEGGVQSPEWSLDGKHILFFSKVFRGEKAEGSDVTIIRRIDYKWDGRGLFDGERIHLFVASFGDGEVRQLTDGAFDVSSTSWSPDGRSVAMVTDIDPPEDVMRAHYFQKIYTVSVDGGEHSLLWEGEKWDVGRVASLAWSPDGRHLVFSGRVVGDLSEDTYKNNCVWIIPSKGGKPINLTEALDRSISTWTMGLIWSPDSGSIFFTAPNKGSTNIYRVDVVTKDIEPVTNEKFTVSGFSVVDSGSRVVFIATDNVTPHEIWVKDRSGSRKITHMNAEYDGVELSEPEEFWVKTSEGLDVHGWIVKPVNFEEGVKYPTILEIHGGPHGMCSYSFNHEYQTLASHGYVVIYTNPRASTGYGEAFAAPVYGLWGVLDSRDIMEAIDYAIKEYSFIDEERLGVTGLSYGGYMTNWLVGHTDRFKAAVSRNSLTNMYSAWGTSDIGWMGHEISRAKTPWKDTQFYLEQSPIHYIENIKTPLLLTHCEQDHRCPMEQSEQLYTGLKRLGREVEFVRFPGESHVMIGIGTPKHRTERLRHILRWFDRYLNKA